MGGILGIHTFDALILSEPMSSASLRNVVKSITKASLLPQKQKEQFIQIVGDFGAFGPIRNTVAHHQWTSGTRSGSLRPVSVDIRSGDAKLLGMEDSERDWLASELLTEAAKIQKLNSRILEFQVHSGLAASIAKKDVDTKAAIEQALGI